MKYDLLVIGGGILGTFHAFHAYKKGLKVALVERNAQPVDASVRNFGQVVPSGMDSKWQMYGRKSLAFYKELQQSADIEIAANGSIYIASDPEEQTLLEELHQINKSNDYPSVLLTKAQALDKYPHINPNYVKSALFFPQEISANPRKTLYKIHKYLRAVSNIDFYFNTPILDITASGANEVAAYSNEGKKIAAQKAIICTGSEFKLLFPDIYKDTDISLVKLQMLRLKPQLQHQLLGNILTGLTIRRYESFHECPSFAAIKAKEDPNSFHKKWGIHILFKQEADGSIIIGDSHEYSSIDKSENLSFDTNQEITDYMIQEASKIILLEHTAVDTTWLGFYAQSEKHDIFQYDVAPNIHIATAIGGKGMTGSAGFSYFNINKIFNDEQ